MAYQGLGKADPNSLNIVAIDDFPEGNKPFYIPSSRVIEGISQSPLERELSNDEWVENSARAFEENKEAIEKALSDLARKDYPHVSLADEY